MTCLMCLTFLNRCQIPDEPMCDGVDIVLTSCVGADPWGCRLSLAGAAAPAHPASACAAADDAVHSCLDSGSSADSAMCGGSGGHRGDAPVSMAHVDSGGRHAGDGGAAMALEAAEPALQQPAAVQLPLVLPGSPASDPAPLSAASSSSSPSNGRCGTPVPLRDADGAACETPRTQHSPGQGVTVGITDGAHSHGCESPPAVLSPWKQDAAADDASDADGASCGGSPTVELSLRKQEAVLEARRRADLADLRSIMAAGAAAHGCTSPAPAMLQVTDQCLFGHLGNVMCTHVNHAASQWANCQFVEGRSSS